MMITYDEIAYASKVHRGRHIERLHTQAFLRGFRPTLPAHARVLELGCGTGEALFPMAIEYPGAVFVGLDNSTAEIASGEELKRKLNVENITFINSDLLHVSASELGTFDFILCHGVYSWCSEEARGKILDIIKECLVERGVALVSYNVYPGSSFRSVASKILGYYDNPQLAAEERAKKLREVIQRLLGSIDYDFEHPYNIILHRELSRVASEGDHYLFHEVLNDKTKPLLVADFLNTAASHGLRFLGDARFGRVSLNRMLSGNNPSQGFQNILQLSSDQIQIEQTMDFLFGTPFRETLLCRADQALEPEILLDTLKALSFAAHISPEDENPGFNDQAQMYASPIGKQINVSKPLLKAVLEVMRKRYPDYTGFAEVFSSARSLTKQRGFAVHDFDENVLAGALLEWMQREVVDFSLHPPEGADRVHAHPATSSFVRWQVENNRPLTNLFYETVDLDPLARELLGKLDGNADLVLLQSCAKKLIADGKGSIKEDGEVITDHERIEELLPQLLESTLETLRKAGLLTK